MQFFQHRNVVIVFSVCLMLSMAAASTMLIPTTSAHTPPWQIPTYAYINVAPDPVGVGQKVSVLIWLDKTFDPAIALTNDWRFHNYNLTITKPDGSTETHIFDVVKDTTSSQFYAYTPDQVGKYTFTFNFPGQVYNTYSHNPASALVNDTYLPSIATTTLTVQSEQLPNPITSYPLPSEYWTRPIYGENTDWWTISSNWLGTGAAGYGVWSSSMTLRNPGDAIGPLTSHVMWTKPLQSGGVVGGNQFAIQGDTSFEGSAYNQRFQNPIIVNGKLYYTEPRSFTGVENQFQPGTTPPGPTDCVDLRTGELIWSRSDVPPLSFALIWDVQDPNQHGVYPAILFTSNFARAFDADTGDPLFNVTNVPSGASGILGAATPGLAASSPVAGPWGEQLHYVMANAGTTSNPNWTLGEWNSTKLWSGSGFPGNTTTLDPIIGGTVDAGISTGVSSRYDYNVTIPWANTIPTIPSPFGGPPSPGFSVVATFYNDVMLCQNGTLPGLATSQFGTTSSAPYTYFAVNLNASRATIGTVLWWNTVTAPPGNITVSYGPADPQTRVFTEAYKETMQWVGYSLDTGAKIWGPTASQTAFDYYGNPALPYINGQVAYGKLYSVQFGGILYAYDLKTGNLTWTYGNGGSGNSTNAGFYNAYGVYPTFINAVGNGVLYMVTSEHTVTTPIFKGALTRAINATDGTEIWTLSSYVGEFFAMSFAIADGYATWFNGYDNQIYSVGRGPSAITVSSSKVQTIGGNVVIDGTVMDVSAGTKQDQQAADFPNGVPCASDASMKDWMGYVYQQKPLPTNFTGVPVTIDVLDSNGNYRNIGTATTDATGAYSFTWKPDITGNFIVIATFHGTNGYWPSYTETSFNIMEAPSASPTPTPGPAAMTDTYILSSAVAIIIVIIIVGAVIVLMQRRRP